MNVYAYVNDAPTRFVDPSGLFSLRFSETWTHRTVPWWDFNDWGYGNTAASVHLDVDCVQVGDCVWQRRIKLSVHFDVEYGYFSSSREKEHIDIAKNFLKGSAPQALSS